MILVTGAAGFIGKRLLDGLIADGLACRSLSRTPSSEAFWNHFAAPSKSGCAVPVPVASRTARLCMALALPFSAAAV